MSDPSTQRASKSSQADHIHLPDHSLQQGAKVVNTQPPERQSRWRKFRRILVWEIALGIPYFYLSAVMALNVREPIQILSHLQDNLATAVAILVISICLSIGSREFFVRINLWGLAGKILAMIASDHTIGAKIDPSDSHKTILIKSSNNCELLAAHHSARAKYYLATGIVVACVGLIFYIVQLSNKNNTESPIFLHNLAHILRNSADNALAQSLSGSQISDLRVALEKVAELQGPTEALSWKVDVIPIIRISLAFLFIEIVAGMFFSLSQKNERQASHWRAHRQVYDRILIANQISNEFFGPISDLDKKIELTKFLLAPVPLEIAEANKKDNPTLLLVDSIKEALKEVRDIKAPEEKKSASGQH